MIGAYCLRGAAVVIALGVSASAFAEDRQSISTRVGYSDLNLATVSGQTAFKLRIDRAAAQTCESLAGGLQGSADRKQCIREMKLTANTRLATLIAARGVHPSSAAGSQ